MEMVSITFSGRRIGPGDPYPLMGSTLVGREDDLRQIVELLDQDHARLIALTGPAGVGKTRLAHKIAGRLGGRFEQGVACVRLESVSDDGAVPREVARALGLREHSQCHAPRLLADALADAHVLLVLDGFDHTADSRVWLHDLLTVAPLLKVVVTSREPLGFPHEHEYQVRPLSPAEAAEVFLRRASEIVPGFSPDQAEMEAVEEICNRVGGIPLAVEIAASWTKDISPGDLPARLDDRPESLPPEAGPVWSYDLLQRPEQMLLCRLAMFSGGFTEDAANFVACWPDAPAGDAALESLTSLVDYGLVSRTPGSAPLAFQMHEAIRSFEQCHDPVNGDDLAPLAFAEYYRSLGARAEEGLAGPQQVRWLDLLEDEYPNIRHALAWLEANDRLHHAVELLSQIQYFISIRGHTLEILERMVRWLDATMLVPWSPEHGLAQLTLGRLYQNTGQFELSIRMLTEAAATFMANGDLRHAAMAKTLVAADYALMGLTEEVGVLASEALELARPLGMSRFVAAALSWQAWHAEATGDQERADALREEVSGIARETGDRWAMSFGLAPRARTALEAGDCETAERLATELRDILAEIGSLHDLPAAYQLLAMIAEARGDLESATNHLQQAISHADACGNRPFGAVLALQAADVELRRGRLDESGRYLSGAMLRHDASVLGARANDILYVCAALAHWRGEGVASARFLGAASVTDMAFAEGRDSLAESLRQELGPDCFEREFASGIAWDADTALRAARTFLDAPRHETQIPFPD